MDRDEALELLGITIDVEEDVARRAYLKAIRQHPPEEDPAGFQRLREAYDTVRVYLRRAAYVVVVPAPARWPEPAATEAEGCPPGLAAPNEPAELPLADADDSGEPDIFSASEPDPIDLYDRLDAVYDERSEATADAALVALRAHIADAADDLPLDLLGAACIALVGEGLIPQAAELVAAGRAWTDLTQSELGPFGHAPVRWLEARELVGLAELLAPETVAECARAILADDHLQAGMLCHRELGDPARRAEARARAPMLWPEIARAPKLAASFVKGGSRQGGWWMVFYPIALTVFLLFRVIAGHVGTSPPSARDIVANSAKLSLQPLLRGAHDHCRPADAPLCTALEVAVTNFGYTNWRCWPAVDLADQIPLGARFGPLAPYPLDVQLAPIALRAYCERNHPRRGARAAPTPARGP